MTNRFTSMIAAGLAGLLLMGAFTSVTKAELGIEELRQLLQESLTISEIDRELARIEEEEMKVQAQILETEAEMEQQLVNLENARVHAGHVLRAYYTGERDALWLLLLKADSFSDAVFVLQYLRIVAKNDIRAMDRFAAAQNELKLLQQQLTERHAELQKLKASYLAQKDRIETLQAELDRKLQAVEDAEALLASMEALNQAWRNEGLPVFRQFLDAMSSAMLRLPDYFSENEDALKQRGRTFTFTIREAELNEFLRKHDELFERFVYTLTEDHVIITGQQGNTRITVKGHFAMEAGPEESLRFILDELTYNDFILPDTTITDMQNQFKMTFYPKQNELTALLSLTELTMSKGEFQIVMRLGF